MRYLVDTHLLLWSKATPKRLGAKGAKIIADPDNWLSFSVVAIWEIVIKAALGRPGFDVVPTSFRRDLLDSDYEELPVSAAHVLAVSDLPRLHDDPFDRLLIAQAKSEGIKLLTGDHMLARYGSWVELI